MFAKKGVTITHYVPLIGKVARILAYTNCGKPAVIGWHN